MPAIEYLFSLARRYQVKFAKLAEGKYRIAGLNQKIILMVVDEDGDVWYGTYGVPPYLHPLKRHMIPASCYAQGNYGMKAEDLEEPFSAASTQENALIPTTLKGDLHKHAATKEIRYREQQGRCKYCNKFIKYTQATIDHMVPLAAGGADAPFNIAVACLPCNERKGQATAEQFMALITKEEQEKAAR